MTTKRAKSGINSRDWDLVCSKEASKDFQAGDLIESNKRKLVLVVSSNRADYGLLEPLMKQLISEKEINFGLIVTGSHLLKSLGLPSMILTRKFKEKHLQKSKYLNLLLKQQ